MMNLKRIRILKEGVKKQGPVIYWMSRDQRVQDNWALIYAQEIALSKKEPLVVVFCVVNEFLDAKQSSFDFMLSGLYLLREKLNRLNIDFMLLSGRPETEIFEFIKKIDASCIVTDFDPLKIKKQWKINLSKKINIPLIEVDAHNIVPCWVASEHQEYSAYTFRIKLNKLLPDFLESYPIVRRHPFKTRYSRFVRESEKIVSKNDKAGEVQAFKRMHLFIKNKLDRYALDRNDPSLNGQSGLSVYLHFGQISAQRVALEVSVQNYSAVSKNAYLEELIIRKELADNFCFYNSNYDNFHCLPEWAYNSLSLHKKDKRDYIYNLKALESAKTHDLYWNTAQLQMMSTGKMHGYMRMYWGKKIIEWTKSPKQAFDILVYLNNKYELDGRDPNGYAGIAWCFGMHDRPWATRRVFGSVRYMNAKGLERKFNMRQYVAMIDSIKNKFIER